MVETSLMLPWLFIFFLCVFDFGFYAYAAICTQNAARAVAMRMSEDGSLSDGEACHVALGEMIRLPNVKDLDPNSSASCPGLDDRHPVVVSVRQLSATTLPPCADCALNPLATSSQATVTYRSIPLFPVPTMMGRMTLTRIAEVRVRVSINP